MLRNIAVGLLAVSALACATPRHSAFERLSDEKKEQFAKYQQFMTSRQEEHYLLLETDAQRDNFIAHLNVEGRLARYPQHVQDAIWMQQVVPGMDSQAVIFAWGPPEKVEKLESLGYQGLQKEVWYYDRERRRVRFLDGSVEDVEDDR